MQEAADLGSRGARVLIVEDEFLIAMDIEEMLNAGHHQVVGTAFSVDGALRLLETLMPDVAVLDGNLRGVSVAPVALKLKERSVPFVLASAHDFTDIDGSGNLGRAINIGKPIRAERLLEALRQALTDG